MRYDIDRFVKMHKEYYSLALEEIKDGCKKSHWMWFIFPQLKGLGRSSTANYYGISGVEEVKEYMNNEYLRHNMIEICNELLKVESNADFILGHPDNLKLRSSMTLFDYVFPNEKVFKKVIDKFFDGKKDEKTLNMLRRK